MTVYWARRGGKTHFVAAMKAAGRAACAAAPEHARAVFMQTARDHAVLLPGNDPRILESMWIHYYEPAIAARRRTGMPVA